MPGTINDHVQINCKSHHCDDGTVGVSSWIALNEGVAYEAAPEIVKFANKTWPTEYGFELVWYVNYDFQQEDLTPDRPVVITHLHVIHEQLETFQSVVVTDVADYDENHEPSWEALFDDIGFRLIMDGWRSILEPHEIEGTIEWQMHQDLMWLESVALILQVTFRRSCEVIKTSGHGTGPELALARGIRVSRNYENDTRPNGIGAFNILVEPFNTFPVVPEAGPNQAAGFIVDWITNQTMFRSN